MMPALDFFGPGPQRPPQPAPPRPAQVPPRPAQAAAPPRPASAPVQPALPPPTVRMQSQDEPAARQASAAALPLTMPSPEQLGVAHRPAGSFDWSAVHRRLDQLGCCCFQMEQQARGCKLVCLLPSGQPGKSHRIEVEAADSAEAARLLLQQADAWVARK